jgi:phosphoglycolate phosphatase
MEPIACSEVIFDLDGTLWTPVSLSLVAWRTACQDLGFDCPCITTEALLGTYGMMLSDASEILLPGIPPDQQELITECVFALENKLIAGGGGDLYPDVREVLTTLSHSKRLFIASNCQSGYIEAFLQSRELGHLFCDTVALGDTGLSKARNVQLLMARNAITDAVFVGDAETDLNAARANNLPFIYASYGYGKVAGYDYRIDAFKDLVYLMPDSN